MRSIKLTILWLTIFSIAMGFLETAVVVYLRRIYYPNGFEFPLVRIESDILLVEVLREFATIIMLAMIGVLLGKNKLQRFALFIYSFAIWDIFYYIFLKALLNWPESFFTPDILFLIPVPWVGPVVAPIILAISMIILALTILTNENLVYDQSNVKSEMKLLIGGSFIAIISFVLNYFTLIEGNSVTWFPGNEIATELISSKFSLIHWILFFSGEALIAYSIIRILKSGQLKIYKGE